MVGTGQTGLIQGARYGVALDAIPCQFASGEMEAAVVEAFEQRAARRDHRRGPGRAQPPGVPHVDLHPPRQPPAGRRPPARARRARCSATSPSVPMPTAASEIDLIQTFADTTVIGLTINHEHMTDAEVTAADHDVRVRARHPRDRRADPLARPTGRHGAARVPGARPRSWPPPRHERAAVGDRPRSAPPQRLDAGRRGSAPRGISVTGVTKATLGSPEVARELLAAGVTSHRRLAGREPRGDASRRASTRHMTLIRSPMLSQVDRVVAAADMSLEHRARRHRRAVGRGRDARDGTHGVVLMVELGDLREGILPRDLEARRPAHAARSPTSASVASAPTWRVRTGSRPTSATWPSCPALANSLERTLGSRSTIVSGGNSANLDWALGTADVGRIDDLRLGESILLGLRTRCTAPPIDGSAHRRVHARRRGDRVEAQAVASVGRHRPDRLRDARTGRDRRVARRARRLPRHRGARPPGRGPRRSHRARGLAILGASSDHLVLDTGSTARSPVGSRGARSASTTPRWSGR